jgi:prophage regulatory protein
MSQRHIMRLPEVMKVAGLKRSSLYILMNTGRFPKASPITGQRAVGWSSSEVQRWVNAKLDGQEWKP